MLPAQCKAATAATAIAEPGAGGGGGGCDDKDDNATRCHNLIKSRGGVSAGISDRAESNVDHVSL